MMASRLTTGCVRTYKRFWLGRASQQLQLRRIIRGSYCAVDAGIGPVCFPLIEIGLGPPLGEDYNAWRFSQSTQSFVVKVGPETRRSTLSWCNSLASELAPANISSSAVEHSMSAICVHRRPALPVAPNLLCHTLKWCEGPDEDAAGLGRCSLGAVAGSFDYQDPRLAALLPVNHSASLTSARSHSLTEVSICPDPGIVRF